jgi:hypothetical protein
LVCTACSINATVCVAERSAVGITCNRSSAYRSEIIERIVILTICDAQVSRSGYVDPFHRIVTAVGKHVIAQQALTCTYKHIRIDESAPGGIVISALEIIEPGAYGTLLATGPFLA